jgi:excisionase family DNA binding protein
MRLANEYESEDETIEDDHFFLWKPGRDAAGTKDVPKLLCTVIDVSSALSLSRSKVYELINSGALPTVHIGRSVRVRMSDLEVFVESRATNTSQPLR